MYILGIDLGTTSMICLLYKDGKELMTKVSTEYPLYTDKGGISEQDPKYWIQAFETNVTKLEKEVEDFKELLTAISVSGQMHSLVTLDKKGEVIRPAILWNDTRTTSQVKKLNENISLLNSETENKAIEGFTLPKILWMKENELDLYNKINKLMMPKDYLNYYLTGKIATDETDASGTIALNVKDKTWSQKIIDYYDLDIDIFPEILKPGQIVGTITKEIKDKFNFKKDINVFMGAADNVASALGIGIYNDKKAMLSLGTSGVYLALEPKFRKNDGSVHYFNYADDNYYSMGVTLTAGKSLSWYKDLFAPNTSYDDLLKDVAKSNIGANNLLFAPYLQGERTPHTSSTIRGSFIGLDVRHKQHDLTRSVIEGITYSLKECQEIIEQSRTNQTIEELIVVGGGAKSDIWLQIIADIMGKDVSSVEVEEGAALGSVILAATEMGIYKDYKEAYEHLNDIKKVYRSDNNNVMEYKHSYNIYKNIYKQTKDLTKKLQKNN